MASEVREIPGYYYDKDKNKYFKIQASHTAPASSAYSSHDVKRRKTRDKRTTIEEAALKKRIGRIRRSKIFEVPTVGGLLMREYGRPKLEMGHVFCRGLVQRGHSLKVPISSEALFHIDHRSDLSPGTVDITTVCGSTLVTAREIDGKFFENSRVEHFWNPGETTSLSINRENNRLITTWRANLAHTGIAITPWRATLEANSTAAATVLLGPGMARSDEVDINCSTTAPPSSSLLFAIGSSHGILGIDKRNHDMNWLTSPPFNDTKSLKDVFALEFLSDNPSILLSGGRPGLLHITDLRLPQSIKQECLTHPSSITKIKQIDNSRFLVAGLESTLNQYDLRYRRQTYSSPSPPRSTTPRKRNPNPTRPILSYSSYYNPTSLTLGFDLDVPTGVIATTQHYDVLDPESLHYPPLQMFSLHGGYTLPSPRIYKPLPSQEFRGEVRCLQFVEDEGEGRKYLYVGGVQGRIMRFSWGEEEEDGSGLRDLKKR